MSRCTCQCGCRATVPDLGTGSKTLCVPCAYIVVDCGSKPKLGELCWDRPELYAAEDDRKGSA